MNPLKRLVRTIDTIYIDSTFLNKNYRNFPGQIRSAIAICKLIKEWLDKSAKHVVSLKMPARYGYELLFMEIGRRLRKPIHINEEELMKYKYIPELDGIFTTKANNSTIHACFDYQNKNSKTLTCNPELDPALIRVIKPTAMVWKEWDETSDFVRREANEFVRVCYSNHSSLSEIRDFLVYLKPKKLEFNVVPSNPSQKLAMLDAVSDILEKLPSSTNCCAASSTQLSQWDDLSKVSQVNFKFSRKCEETNELLGPPKRKKKIVAEWVSVLNIFYVPFILTMAMWQ